MLCSLARAGAQWPGQRPLHSTTGFTNSGRAVCAVTTCILDVKDILRTFFGKGGRINMGHTQEEGQRPV